MRPYDLIAKKRDGGAHSNREIQELVRAITDGSMPDYQVSAWLMAAYLNGLTDEETYTLTLAMRDSGDRVDLSGIPGVKLDKHSSGGVGDKTSLVVVPLLAAAGVSILKMSGRGLGFSGGTVDKLESIPGLRTDLSIAEAVEQIKTVGAVMIGQSPRLVPADKRLYALRDVTATIENISLIASSIMSKKLAGGADLILLDVKVGRGAFMKSIDMARQLAQTMVKIGNSAGVRTIAALTAMDEPLGYAVGNAIEVEEACALLINAEFVDSRFRELCLELSARALVVVRKATDTASARAILIDLLQSGQAAAKFEEIISAQGGNPACVRDPSLLPRAATTNVIKSEAPGFVRSIDAEIIGRTVVSIGGGRNKKEDAIDPAVGLILRKKSGDSVSAGEVLATAYLNEPPGPNIERSILSAFEIAKSRPEITPVIREFVES